LVFFKKKFKFKFKIFFFFFFFRFGLTFVGKETKNEWDHEKKLVVKIIKMIDKNYTGEEDENKLQIKIEKEEEILEKKF
jgi:hypothetical protein